MNRFLLPYRVLSNNLVKTAVHVEMWCVCGLLERETKREKNQLICLILNNVEEMIQEIERCLNIVRAAGSSSSAPMRSSGARIT
jgi:hypothetical protein